MIVVSENRYSRTFYAVLPATHVSSAGNTFSVAEPNFLFPLKFEKYFKHILNITISAFMDVAKLFRIKHLKGSNLPKRELFENFKYDLFDVNILFYRI